MHGDLNLIACALKLTLIPMELMLCMGIIKSIIVRKVVKSRRPSEIETYYFKGLTFVEVHKKIKMVVSFVEVHKNSCIRDKH